MLKIALKAANDRYVAADLGQPETDAGRPIA